MRRTLWLGLLILGALLAGCGGGSTTTTQSSTPTATAPLPTVTPTPLPTLPVSDVKRACGQFMQTPAVVVGALVIAQQARLGNLAYPATRLADNAAQSPLVVTPQSPTPDQAHPTNPTMHEGGGGYLLVICNMSSVAHTIKRVDVRIESVIPYTEQLNVWAPCTAFYSRNFGVGDQGCGGGDPQDEFLHAPFTADATTGTTVTATQTSSGGASDVSGGKVYGPLPVTLDPGRAMTIEVGMGPNGAGYQAFSAAGTYTFSFSLGIDNNAPVFAVSSPPTLLARPAHTWNGAACTKPAMQSQIPSATNPPTYYICPES